MTINVTVPEATIQLTELLHRVRQGEEVIISEAGIPVARILPVYSKSPRVPGQDRGKVIISPDFDLPLPDDIINDFILAKSQIQELNQDEKDIQLERRK